MDSVRVEHYIKRATDFQEGMLLSKRESHLNSAALLGIHCALSYNDALLTGLGKEKLKSENHQRAADDLNKLLPARRIPDRNGINHLAHLIPKKTPVTYGDKRLAAQDFNEVITKAERFAKWANSVGKELKIEGWRDAN